MKKLLVLILLFSLVSTAEAGTLSITRKTAGTLISATGFNTNYSEIEAVVNGGIDNTNITNDGVKAEDVNVDIVRAGYGLIQHTDGSLYVDVSDTNPSLEITDGGLRAKVDDSSIERATGGLQVKALGITNAMLAGSIADSKLSQITTANKVSETAIEGTVALTRGGTGGTSAAAAYTNIVVPKSYDSGWFAFASGQEYSKTHNLGTTKFLGIIYYATDSSGSNMRTLTDYGSGSTYAAALENITISTLNVQVGAQGIGYIADSTNFAVATSGYLRIVLLALE